VTSVNRLLRLDRPTYRQHFNCFILTKTVCVLLHTGLYVEVHGNFKKNIAGGEWFLLRSFLLTVGIHLARLYSLEPVHNIGHAVSDFD